MRKDRVSVRLFLLSNTILAPNLLPLSAHSQQDEVSLRAATDGERDGEGLCWSGVNMSITRSAERFSWRRGEQSQQAEPPPLCRPSIQSIQTH